MDSSIETEFKAAAKYPNLFKYLLMYVGIIILMTVSDVQCINLL